LYRKKSDKTNILVRLSNLIIFQVLFIFSALVLILFFPEGKRESHSGSDPIGDRISQLNRQLGQKSSSIGSDSTQWPDSNSFKKLIGPESPFLAVAIYQIGPDSLDSPMVLASWEKDLGGDTDSPDQGYTFAEINMDMLSLVADRQKADHLSFRTDSRHYIHYYRILTDSDPPSVLVVVTDYDTNRSMFSDMRYAIFVLFLFSALVALLTIHLIFKRLKKPMDRLIRGLEKTASGELYYLVESNSDQELERLSSAFNHMTRTLWENQKALKNYNARLKKTNLSLIDSQLFLATLINSTPMSIMVTSPDGRIMLANTSASQDFGCDCEDLKGRNINDIVSVSSAEAKADTETPWQTSGTEALCQRSDNEFFPAYVISSPIQTGDAEPRAYLYILNDITESRDFQEMMVRLDRYCTRGEMAGDIAHEINNYLAILSGNLELLPILLRKGNSEKLEKKIELMRSTVDRIVRFAAGLMDAQQDEACFEPGSMNQVVENVLAFLKPQNKFDNVQLMTNLGSDLSIMKFDQGQIQQLLVNLIYNAADALQGVEEGKAISVHTMLHEVDGEQCARVEVHDNGPGVREDKVDSLFKERFTTRRKGHGIGLITCRRIVETHSGRIGYRYEDGAVFYFSIPLVRRPAELIEEETREIPAENVSV